MKALRFSAHGLLCCSLSILFFARAAQAGRCNAAIWADGGTSSGGNNVDVWLNSFGCITTFVTNAEIDTPGFLDSFNVLFVTRSGESLGTGLDLAGAKNVKSFVVGAGGTPGAVFLFLNDWLDNTPYANSGDPYDPNTTAVMRNAVTSAAASGHGYVGELNGAAMALRSNLDGFVAMSLVGGSATTAIASIPRDGVTQVAGHGIGIGNFTPLDLTCYGVDTTGIPASGVVYEYTSGEPAVASNYPHPPSSPEDQKVRPGVATLAHREGNTAQ